jgi:hypothetical protein
VLSEDYSRFLQPGEEEIGFVAREAESRSATSTTNPPPARPFLSSTGSVW